jgi:hypothetical protein
MSLIINYSFEDIIIEILQNQNNYSLNFTINQTLLTRNFLKYNKAYNLYNLLLLTINNDRNILLLYDLFFR